MSDDVFVPKNRHGKGRKIYHTDEDCYHLDHAASVRSISLDALTDDYRECTKCAGEVTDPGGAGRGHYQSVMAAAKDDGWGGTDD